MKSKSKLIKVFSIIIPLLYLISTLNMCFADGPTLEQKVDWFGESVLETLQSGALGIVGVLSFALQVTVLSITASVNTLFCGFDGLNGVDGAVELIKKVLFNEVSITTAHFFKIQGGASGLAQNIGKYFGLIELLAVGVLLFILIYVGIRIATSVVGQEKAKYTSMLLSWVVSLILVFCLTIIMVTATAINDTIVKKLSEDAKETGTGISVSELVKERK